MEENEYEHKWKKYKTKILNLGSTKKISIDFGDMMFDIGSLFQTSKYRQRNEIFIESLKQMFTIAGYYELFGIDGKKYDLEIKQDIFEGNAGRDMFSVYIVNIITKTRKRIFILKPKCNDNKQYSQIENGSGNIQYQDILHKYNETAKNNISMPVIPILEKIFIFTDTNKKKQCMAIMHVAQGKSYCKIFGDDTEEQKEESTKAFGKSMSKFNFYDFDKTNITKDQNFDKVQVYTHTDCHCGNMIYNDITKRVYFIDFDGFYKHDLNFQIMTIIMNFNAYLDVFFDAYIEACDELYRKNVVYSIYKCAYIIREYYKEKVINICKKYIPDVGK